MSEASYSPRAAGGSPELEPRPPSFSRTELAELMLPFNANVLGKAFGGVVLGLIDKAAATAAIRHAGRTCVTAQVDRITFHAPIEIGELVQVEAVVNSVGRSSMEVGVTVRAMNIHAGTTRHTNTCYVTMVALDDGGSPAPVPPLLLETPEDADRQRRAQERMTERKAHRARETGRL